MERRTVLKLAGAGAGALAGVTTLAGTSVAGAGPDSNTGVSWLMAKELVARGPNPERRDGLMLYGQFVGSWRCQVKEFFGDRLEYEVDWVFGWVLAGNAVQDVFAQTEKAQERGTTIRVYDPVKDNWQVSWFGPVDTSLSHFTATQVGDEIHQTGAEFEGSPMRWIFSEITQNRFMWRSEIFVDDSLDWHKVIELEAIRRV